MASIDRIEEVIDGLRRALAQGAQVYWVCPLIESSDKSELAAAEERHAHLAQIFGADAVGLLHGGMAAPPRTRPWRRSPPAASRSSSRRP